MLIFVQCGSLPRTETLTDQHGFNVRKSHAIIPFECNIIYHFLLDVYSFMTPSNDKIHVLVDAGADVLFGDRLGAPPVVKHSTSCRRLLDAYGLQNW